MKKRKLNHVIHNLNTIEKTADFLLDILIETNKEKNLQALQVASNVNNKQLQEKI